MDFVTHHTPLLACEANEVHCKLSVDLRICVGPGEGRGEGRKQGEGREKERWPIHLEQDPDAQQAHEESTGPLLQIKGSAIVEQAPGRGGGGAWADGLLLTLQWVA